MTEICLEATLANLDKVNAFVEEQLEACDCPMKASMQMMVALEELFVNIAHYAYGDATGMATVQVEFKDGMALVHLIDSGAAFNPLEKEDPDVTLAASERAIGGLGIFMVKKSMDVFTYERVQDQNVVTFGKKIA